MNSLRQAHYTALATAQWEQATTAEERETAEKAQEVAQVYTVYQASLEQEHWLDFGDLIFKSVVLLQSHPDVCEAIQRTYRHILVDEYQDVNRASGILLRAVAGTGNGLWVVGDVRQAIYRFRGAAPSNMHLFPQDFPGAHILSLARNYRSQPRIVEAFATLAPRMRAIRGTPFHPWEKARPDAGGHVRLEIADDLVAEGEGLAREIRHVNRHTVSLTVTRQSSAAHTRIWRASPRSWNEKAFRCSILGISSSGPKCGTCSRWCPSPVKARGVVWSAWRVSLHTRFRSAMSGRCSGWPASSRSRSLGRSRSRSLPRPFQTAGRRASPSSNNTWMVYAMEQTRGVCWLSIFSYEVHIFARSSLMRRSLGSSGGSRCISSYNSSMNKMNSLREQGGEPKRLLLEFVRRLELFGEEKQLRHMPEWASALDAVRLLTVHASKGLEFRAVYVPILGQGYFPVRRHARPCPPPIGMVSDGQDDEHDEEEECLFFVALSRARDVLCLSRARRYGARNSNGSPLLMFIAEVLPCPPDGAVTWKARQGSAAVPAVHVEPPKDLPVFEAAALDRYMTCPRQYYYEYILGLSGRREDSAYVQFHRCVYSVLRWITDAQAQGRAVDETTAQNQLVAVWATQGPVDHPYASIYLRNATDMVRRAVHRRVGSHSANSRPTFEVSLRLGRVRFTPDHVERRDDGSEVLQRLRTGRISAGEKDKTIYALYHSVARSRAPRREVQIVSLSSDAVESVNLREQTIDARLARYDEAIGSILTGHFPPQPSERECPRCPHYFICPSAEDDTTDR